MKKAIFGLVFLLCGTVGAQALEFQAFGDAYAYDLPVGYVGEENTMAKLMTGMLTELFADQIGVGALLFEGKSLDNIFINPEGINYLMIAYDPSDSGQTSPEEFAEFKAAFAAIMSDDQDLDQVTAYASGLVADIMNMDMGFDMASATLVEDSENSVSMYTTIAVEGAGLENPKFCMFSGQLVNGKVFFVYQYSDLGPDSDLEQLSAQAMRVLNQLNLRRAGEPASPGQANPIGEPVRHPTKSTRNAWR